MRNILSIVNANNNRFWWHQIRDCDYLPLIYQALDEDEINLLIEWYDDTNQRGITGGEMAIPAISLLIGLITGNCISRIVQCGHYLGYSTLLLGFYLRKMKKKRSLYSIDISKDYTEYTQRWIEKANLVEYVFLSTNDSADPNEVKKIREYFDNKPIQLTIIDSSHQFEHTMKELKIYFDELMEGGLMVFHDASIYAQQFDSTQNGGVYRAINEFLKLKKNLSCILINGFVEGGYPGKYPYVDGCGLALIQKYPEVEE